MPSHLGCLYAPASLRLVIATRITRTIVCRGICMISLSFFIIDDAFIIYSIYMLLESSDPKLASYKHVCFFAGPCLSRR